VREAHRPKKKYTLYVEYYSPSKDINSISDKKDWRMKIWYRQNSNINLEYLP